ncbi:hypothetical protein DPMN_002865 [Dreissena polymorpha]|uniref:Uncharacterized protein n=1 Tax=Dreissena polymorpha TaxID=45954 RepID=A0A9D4MNM3_DREPO|nr:hypothetical protein DPMN_002865 [Dreissena polymorpha]
MELLILKYWEGRKTPVTVKRPAKSCDQPILWPAKSCDQRSQVTSQVLGSA